VSNGGLSLARASRDFIRVGLLVLRGHIGRSKSSRALYEVKEGARKVNFRESAPHTSLGVQFLLKRRMNNQRIN
jgi:hypothetical protein